MTPVKFFARDPCPSWPMPEFEVVHMGPRRSRARPKFRAAKFRAACLEPQSMSNNGPAGLF